MVLLVLMIILLSIILGWFPFNKGMCIIGRFGSTPSTEAKDTLASVPIWLSLILCVRCCCPRSWGILYYSPHFIPPANPRPLPPLHPLYVMIPRMFSHRVYLLYHITITIHFTSTYPN